MVRRRRHQPAEKVIQGSPPNCPNDHDGQPCLAPMEEVSFNAAVNMILRGSPEQAGMVRDVLGEHLGALGVALDGVAVTSVPKGTSLNSDVLSVLTWAKKAQAHDENALSQIKALWATASSRAG